MDIKLLLNVLIFLIIGIYIQKIQCINFNNLKEADLIEVDNLFNNWNDYIDTKQRIIIGCFDSDNGIEYDNFIKAINSIESLETKKGLISSKKYSTIFNSNILNSYLGKKGINDIYVEAPEILVFKKDATNHILKYYYSADNNFREDSISKFIVESASEPMTKLEDIQLIDNYYYYIDSDNNHASLYSMEKPFIYLNLKNLNNKYISDVFNVLRQFKNQFNVVYTDENNFIRPPFENLKFSPLSIIKNVKKRGLEEAFDSSQFSDSYVTTIYHYTENMSENVYHQDLSYDFLIDFVNKYNNNTLIPQKPKKHFENQLNNKVIEFKYNDYVLELNNHNFIDVTGDVFKDVYVLVYYPWNEEYEMIKSIWNELAKNLYYERNNIILASYNVLENEVLNTEFKSRNDYPEIILYRSQIDDIENNKKKIIMYRREAGVSYETLASWITYTSKFNILVPFNINHLKLRIENQGYIGNNAEELFNRDKYYNYINNEHPAPKLNYEDIQEIIITSTYYSYQSKTVEIHSQPTYTTFIEPPPIPDPIPKAPENLFSKTLIFDDEAVLSIGIKIPYAEYPPKYIGAKEIKERIIRDEIESEKKKSKKVVKESFINSKATVLNNHSSMKNLKIAALDSTNNNIKTKKNAKALVYEQMLDTMNLNSEQKNKLMESNTKNVKLNEALNNSQSKGGKLKKVLDYTGTKGTILKEYTGNVTVKTARLKEVLGKSGSKLIETSGNTDTKRVKLKEILEN